MRSCCSFASAASSTCFRGEEVSISLLRLAARDGAKSCMTRPADISHMWSAYVLSALAAMHILAARWHQILRKDRLILRMMLRCATLIAETRSHRFVRMLRSCRSATHQQNLDWAA